MANTVIIRGEDGSKRYVLAKLYEVPNGDTRYRHGVCRTGIWITRSGRVLVGTDSLWESDGTTVGQQYHFADAEEIANLAAETADEKLLALVPEAE